MDDAVEPRAAAPETEPTPPPAAAPDVRAPDVGGLDRAAKLDALRTFLEGAWKECDSLGIVLDPSADASARLRAMLDRDPEDWQGPAGEILTGLELLVDAARKTDPPELVGLRGIILLALERGTALPLVTIAHRERVTTSAVRKAVARLEADGLVQRFRDAEDRRLIRVHATPTGMARAREIRCARSATLATWLRRLLPDDVIALVAASRSGEWLSERMRPPPGSWW
jgi:DNA-binding MarR family transcriptional regulator